MCCRRSNKTFWKHNVPTGSRHRIAVIVSATVVIIARWSCTVHALASCRIASVVGAYVSVVADNHVVAAFACRRVAEIRRARVVVNARIRLGMTAFAREYVVHVLCTGVVVIT